MSLNLANNKIEALPFLKKLTNLLQVIETKATEKSRVKASRELLESVLELVETLLKSVSSDLTVRELIIYLLQKIPVKQYLEESLADLRNNLRECQSPRLNFRNGFVLSKVDVLDQSCDFIGMLVGRQLSQFSGEWAQILAKVNSMVPDDDGPPEGPVKAGEFVWEKNPYPFGLKEWLLLQALYGQSEVDDRVVWRAVYGDNKFSSSTLRKLQSRTQNKLNEYHLPFSIFRPTHRCLKLVQTAL